MGMTSESLQNELKTLLGSNHVYFQPPPNLRMHYPCFLVERAGISGFAADNKNYLYTKQYRVTYISNEEDPDMIDTVMKHFQMCSYGKPFVTDNLYHDPFIIYW